MLSVKFVTLLFCVLLILPNYAQITIIAPPPVVEVKEASAAPEPEPKRAKSVAKKAVTNQKKQLITENSAAKDQTEFEGLEIESLGQNSLSGSAKDKSLAKGIHFYSDPGPLLGKSSFQTRQNPALNAIKLYTDFPLIDAPSGLYDFSYSGREIKIVASHSLHEKLIRPGQTLGIGLMVSNLSLLEHQVEEIVIAHEKIKVAHTIAPFVLQPGQTGSRYITLFTDSSLPPGIYQIVYKINSTNQNATLATMNFKFAVNSTPDLKFARTSSAAIKEKSLFKVAGNLYNSGNVNLFLDLSVSGKADNLKVIPAMISLPAGGKSYVEISGKCPELLHPLKNVLELKFSAVARKTGGNFQAASVPIKLHIEAAP